jgi:cob(I)alamin adenosyltransferase
MKIYTKTGDGGETGLVGGTRVPKTDVRLEAYGTVDELNSFVGLLLSYPMNDENRDFLQNIQHRLFTLGAYLATDQLKTTLHEASVLKSEVIDAIETEIDRLNESLPPLQAFILPGGVGAAAVCHVCRSVARRAERNICQLLNVYPVDNLVLIYINRISDYFFSLARFVNMENKEKEIYWKQY